MAIAEAADRSIQGPNPQSAKAFPAPMTREEKKVILASSLGTIFEWYDFCLFGSLAAIFAILTLLVIDVTAVYGPIAAALVEMFPSRIRYTSMCLPHHIGNGWFGGMLPATAFAMVAMTGDIYYGLWCPVVIALGTFVIGLCFVSETKDRDIYAND